MAKRKHTPDMLVRKLHDERSQVKGDENKTSRLAEPLRTAIETHSPDPLAVLFPRAASSPSPFSARIQLAVTATDALAKEIESAVSQALRTLSGVQVVTKEADWTLLILAVALQTPSRGVHGVALSVVVVESLDRSLQEWMRAQKSIQINPERLPEAGKAPSPSSFKGAWLRVTAPSQLSRLCQQVVGDFNNRYLEKRRAAYQQSIPT